MSESTIFDRAISESVHSHETYENATWKNHGGYKAVTTIRDFFFGPRHKRKPKDNRFRFIAESLVSNLYDKEADTVIVKTTRHLLQQHRTIEDTEARRRLEGWACGTIIIYLIVVLCLVILNGLSRIIWPDIFTECGFISDSVMYVILSTTTVNIIGLGIIVLEGHFRKKGRQK